MASRGAGFALLALAAAVAAPADVGVASVQLRAVDAAHRPLSEASAVLVSADDAGAYRARAGAGGALAFYDVPAGAYRLSVEHAGLSPVSAELRLGPGETAWLTAVLSAGEGASRIEGRPEPEAYGSAFDADALRGLPSSRDAWSLLETAETSAVVDRMDNGGLWGGQAPRFAAHSTSSAEASFRLGDADLTDPFGAGTPLLMPDLDGVDGVQAVTALAPASTAGSGPVLVLLPPRPGRVWTGAAQGSATTRGLQADAPAGPPPIARYDWWRRGAFSLRGPLGERFGLALAGSATGVSRFERAEREAREGRIRSLLGQLVWTPASSQEAQLLALVQDARRAEPGRRVFGDGALRDDRSVHVQGAWMKRGDAGGALKAAAAFTRRRSTAAARGDAVVGVADPLSDGPLVDLLLDGPGARQRAEASLALRLAPRAWRHAAHSLTLGLSAGAQRAELFASGPVTVWELGGGLPARVWDFAPRPAASRWSGTELAVHASDRARLGDRVALEAGARLESTRAGSGGASRISWLDLSPRLRARVRIDAGGTLVAFGGWARLRHRLPLRLLAFGDPTAPTALVSRWTDVGDRPFPPEERGPLVAVAGPGGTHSTIDSGLAAPRTDELLAGVELRLGRRAVLRFTGIDRRARRLVESVNVGVERDRYRVFTVPDPGGDFATTADDQQLPVFDRDPASFGADQYLLTQPAGLTARYQGVELVLEAQPFDGLELRLGATAHRSDGSAAHRGFRSDENDPGLPGEFLDNPNADTYAEGRLFFDRAYTIKIAGWYRGGRGGPRLGAVVRYQDGQPFARLVVAPGLAQGPEAVRAIPNGRSRFAYALSLDARAEQGVGLGRARLSAVAEGFNLLGTAHEVEEDVLSGPGFRTPTAQQPPRAFRLGLRLDF